jgi:hypothetical protein
MRSPRDVTELITAVPPTNAPRQVRVRLASPLASVRGDICSRVVHQQTLLIEKILGFSNAQWLECSIEIVPRPALFDHALHSIVALHSSNALPRDKAELQQLGSAFFHISGGVGITPSVFRYNLDFDAHFVSPLVKPAPLQMPLAAVSFCFETSSNEEARTLAATEILLDVYLHGTVAMGGSA